MSVLDLKLLRTSLFGTAKTLIDNATRKVETARAKAHAEKMLKNIESDYKCILLTRFPEERLDEIARLNGIRLKIYMLPRPVPGTICQERRKSGLLLSVYPLR